MGSQDRAKLGIVTFVNGVRNGIAAALSRLVFRKLTLPGDEDRIRRIAVFRIGNVGDIVAAVPTLSAIRRRFPHSHLCLMTSPGVEGAPGARDLIRPGSLVDSLIVYHKPDITGWKARKRLALRVREQGFDLFIELSNVLAPFRQVMQSMALAWYAGCRYAVGFQVGAVRWFPRTQALHTPFLRESERLLETVRRPLDLKENGSGRLPVSDADRASVAEDRIVVFHIGAKRPANRWFPERYAAVADWIQSNTGMRAVFTGSPAEKEQVEQVRRHMRTEPVIVCGELNLLQTAALLERACLYIGNDTGPMHIAAAMGTPVVALFSARDFPEQWRPHGNRHTLLRRDVPCSPCFKDVCDRDSACLDLIRVEDVLNAAREQLQ